MARIADSSFIDDSIGVFTDNVNQISIYLGNLDSVDHSPLVTSQTFNNRVNNTQNAFYDPLDVPPLRDAVREVNFLHNKTQFFSYLLFSSLPPNMANHKTVADSGYFDNLTGKSLTVPIGAGRNIPAYDLITGDSHPGDSDYPHTGLLAVDSANISYLSGHYFKVGSNYFDSPHAGYYSLLNNPSYTAGTGKVWFDSSEVVDFGLVLNVGRINKLSGAPGDKGTPFPFPMPRRSNVDSGFEKDSGELTYDSARFNQIIVGSFFIDSTSTNDSSDFQQFRFANDSNNFTSLEFNSLRFDSNDTFNLPLRRVKTLSITTDSGIDNLSAYLLSPWDSADRIT